MPGRHQHGTTNKNFGITIANMPNDPIIPGHHYMFKVHEGTNRQCILTLDSIGHDELLECIEFWTSAARGMEVHWRDRNKYPWNENEL